MKYIEVTPGVNPVGACPPQEFYFDIYMSVVGNKRAIGELVTQFESRYVNDTE